MAVRSNSEPAWYGHSQDGNTDTGGVTPLKKAGGQRERCLQGIPTSPAPHLLHQELRLRLAVSPPAPREEVLLVPGPSVLLHSSVLPSSLSASVSNSLSLCACVSVYMYLFIQFIL